MANGAKHRQQTNNNVIKSARSSSLVHQPLIEEAPKKVKVRVRKAFLGRYEGLCGDVKAVLGNFKSPKTEETTQQRKTNILPPDILVEIFFFIRSFEDLYAFISSTKLTYELFNNYPTAILTQVAKNMLGHVWEEATTLLVWQRNSTNLIPDYAAVVKDLEVEFVLHRTDIPQLVANQKYFDSCAHSFMKFATLNLTRAQPKLCPSCNPYFTTREIFPIKTFYGVWLLHLYFRYATIEDFAAYECLSFEQYLDHYTMSKVMFRNKHFGSFIFAPRFWNTWDKVLSRNLFVVWLGPPKDARIHETRPILRHKMLCHLVASVAGSMTLPAPNRNWGREFPPICLRFMDEYGVKSLKELIEEYRLSN